VNGLVEQDETIRANTTVERLATLESPFRNDELSARFPQIGWNVTAGNASQISDGAAAMLIVSERMATKLGLKPARVLSAST
jgi:acetyl-CoA C-acetyltransferase/acetyl-CoA acyltransferase